MVHFRDLERHTTPCDDTVLLSVGWLGRDMEYPTGEVAPNFYEKLRELCRNPWQPFATAGFHICDLCQYDGVSLKGQLYVPDQDCIYVAPAGVAHYIAAHWYNPPAAFVQAVLNCPPMQTMDYKKKLLANGGRGLTRAFKEPSQPK
ncbi:DUF7919 family protein [Allorhizobium taibaishanense]|uniref:DUF7919 domain-containing protein n=1 Tax=Allorhizobium taibaishanense TaxID=887144 RepID=A0A1Q8ZZU5_9HYPH|nr:hypothetical protein BJF91_05020 [Allorhizobium taibaishanense]